MAKSSRRSRVRANRQDPISKPVKPPSDPKLAALRETKILPVLKDLKSLDPKARTTAASAIANIVTDTECRKLLLREQVVHTVLTETLTDNNVDGRAAGWEILRVLAQEEEDDFCVHLYRLDILTAIEHAGKAIVETLTASDPEFSKLPKAQQRLAWDITCSLLSLLGALALARDEILDAIVANPTILRFLFRLVSSASSTPEVLEETLNCLMTLSEDNLNLGQAIIADQETSCYDQLLLSKKTGGPRGVLACGVLHNVFSSLSWLDHSPGKDGACDAILIPTLSQALEQLSSSGAKANGHGTANQSGILHIALEILASIGSNLQTTLEKGNRSPLGAKADEEWGGIEDADAPDADAMEVDGGSEDEKDDEEKDASEGESDDEDIEDDMEKVTGADEPMGEEGDIDDLPTLRELIQTAVPQLIRLTNIPITNDDDITTQAHAFSALNNIAWTLSCLEFTNDENANIYAVWAPVAKKIWTKAITPVLDADNADLNLATLVTGLAWAVARSLNGNTRTDGTQHRKFIALYQAAAKAGQGESNGTQGQDAEDQDDPFQGIGVKCIGVLGSLARHPAPIAVNREVGIFLMTLLGHAETPAAEVVEALNQVFDIYGDEEPEFDKEVFWKDGFLKHLEALLPRLKTIAKGIDKRKAQELRTKADEAILNLGRFIKYKQKHVPR
ncbi:synchronized import protein 1 [Echria macrotheca]|uniref:Synchronized import protein 1 n=1 Tax=Echria macrotheca TaxID=438768 RepID=A0AAJ0BLH8_9PEZI|nr:synchronized import protein 1 [Echria macrotheca]